MERFYGMGGLIEKQFFVEFMDMLNKYGVSEEIKELAIKLINDDRNKYSPGGMNLPNCLTAKLRGDSIRANFFGYIDDLAKKHGDTFVRDFVTSALKDVSINFDIYENMSRDTKTNFVNLFLREMVEAFPEDVKIVMGAGKPLKDWTNYGNYGNLEVRIAGVSLGHLYFDAGKTNVPNIQFTDFRTLPGLEGLGLGSYMFSELCRQVVEYNPECTILACNVKKGYDGEAVYSKWGAYPTNSYKVEGYDFYFDEKPLTQEEYDAMNGSLIYYFNVDAVHHMAEYRSDKYGLDNDPDVLD